MAASDLEHGLARDRLTHNHGENAFHIVFRKKFRSYLVRLCIHSTELDSYRTGCILASLFRNDKPREIVFRARWLAKIYASCVIFSRIARRGLSSLALHPRQKLQRVECDKHRIAALLFTDKLCNIFYVRKYRNNTLARATIMFPANFYFLRQRKKKNTFQRGCGNLASKIARKEYAKQGYFRKLLSKTNFSQNINSIGNVYARSGGVSVAEGKIREFSWFGSEFGPGNAREPSKIQ